jgi:hypothetical protein
VVLNRVAMAIIDGQRGLHSTYVFPYGQPDDYGPTAMHLYQKAGKDGQKIAGHASETMTKNYQKDHAEIVWSEAIPDLNISEITG